MAKAPTLKDVAEDLNLTAGQNHFYIWIFDDPTSVTLAGPDLLTSTATASLTGINSEDLRFKNMLFYLDNTTDRVSIDEIRLGLTFAVVSPIPEPSSMILVLGAVGSLVSFRRRLARKVKSIQPTKW